MARDPYVERRMLNWMRWRSGAGSVGLGYGSASIWDRIKVDVSPNRESIIPTNAIEAEETDRAIESLPDFLKETVHVFYLTDDTVEVKAGRLACGVSTVHSRISDAHRRISVWFHDKEARAAALRERNEATQAAARVAIMRRAGAIVLPDAPAKGKRPRRK